MRTLGAFLFIILILTAISGIFAIKSLIMDLRSKKSTKYAVCNFFKNIILGIIMILDGAFYFI